MQDPVQNHPDASIHPPIGIRLLRFYYAATAVFLLLDYVADLNLRLAFLEPWPGWRLVYYGFCFGCLAVIAWRPALTGLVTTVESAITLSALIIGMGVRVLSLSATVIESGRGVITVEEIVNFLVAGTAAWLGWFGGIRALGRDDGRPVR